MLGIPSVALKCSFSNPILIFSSSASICKKKNVGGPPCLRAAHLVLDLRDLLDPLENEFLHPGSERDPAL